MPMARPKTSRFSGGFLLRARHHAPSYPSPCPHVVRPHPGQPTEATRCRSLDGKPPENREVSTCRPRLLSSASVRTEPAPSPCLDRKPPDFREVSIFDPPRSTLRPHLHRHHRRAAWTVYCHQRRLIRTWITTSSSASSTALIAPPSALSAPPAIASPQTPTPTTPLRAAWSARRQAALRACSSAQRICTAPPIVVAIVGPSASRPPQMAQAGGSVGAGSGMAVRSRATIAEQWSRQSPPSIRTSRHWV
jgi:hypothetical protein